MEWSGTEIAYLKRNASLGAAAIAEDLGRSVAAVERQAHRLRITLRRPGSRKGSILGQPRGESLAGLVDREWILEDPERAERIAERLRLDREAELCPCCATREATVKTSGLCLPCHRHRLAQAHRETFEEELAGDAALRALWQERQRLKRLRELKAETAP